MTTTDPKQGDTDMQRQRLSRGLAAVAIVALIAAGCGDDDSDSTSSRSDAAGAPSASADSSGADVEAYCDAVLDIETAPPPDVDFETASPDEQAAALRAYATETIQPLVADAVATVPDEIADEGEVVSGAFAELAETGDPSVMEQPDTVAASDTLHAFELENCGWTRQDVTASEYAFAGLPDELEAGTVSFELANDGTELHELQLFRRNDGVTEPVEELLALPEEQVMSKVTPVGSGAFAPPGESSYMVVDLDAGDYIALCFVPTGTTSEDQPPAPDAPPHIAHGMVAELAVS
jgi:hypothetical protein